MGGGTADGRPTGVILLLETIHDHRRHQMASLPIPDELMAEILLRLPTPADLTRASVACVSFRRVAADRSLLRRYRKLHGPLLLGLLEGRKIFYPAIAPHRSASVASAVDLAADFSFSFLPAPAMYWVVRDVRDGRVLLDRIPKHGIDNRYGAIFWELVVCDPSHRRYLLLPPIPAALVEDPMFTNKQLRVETFLLHPEAATADETSFRVIWMAQCKTRVAAFAFSSTTRQWRAVPSRRWSDLSAGLPLLLETNLFYSRHYVYGCFYWLIADWRESKLLVLDTKAMEFSIAEPPPEAKGCCDFAMVEAGEGRPGMFLPSLNGFNLSYFIRQNDGGSYSQWQKVKTISVYGRIFLICNMGKYLLLFEHESALTEARCFTLDIETFQHEKLCALGSTVYKLHANSNFLPSLLSLPTISSRVENAIDKEMVEQGRAASSSTKLACSE